MSRTVRLLGLAAPLALVAIPTSWVASAPTVCLIRRVTGRRCPGCGMTRALSALAHGDPRSAWRYNPRVVIVAPLLLGVWARTLASFADHSTTHDNWRPTLPEGARDASCLGWLNER